MVYGKKPLLTMGAAQIQAAPEHFPRTRIDEFPDQPVSPNQLQNFKKPKHTKIIT
jgi:hypothetical protein